jgi:hypothetical protein
VDRLTTVWRRYWAIQGCGHRPSAGPFETDIDEPVNDLGEAGWCRCGAVTASGFLGRWSRADRSRPWIVPGGLRWQAGGVREADEYLVQEPLGPARGPMDRTILLARPVRGDGRLGFEVPRWTRCRVGWSVRRGTGGQAAP